MDGNPAHADDVRERWRGSADLPWSTEQINTDLEDAWHQLLTEAPAVVGADEDRVKGVLARVVVRYYLTPGGVVQETETRGPFTKSRSYGSSGSGDGPTVTQEDVRAALGLPGSGRQRAFSIDTTPGR